MFQNQLFMDTKETNILDFPKNYNSNVDEIMSQPPSWLVRWGITVFFGVLLSLLALSWFLKYPDLVTGSLRISAINAPKSILAKADGRLIKLFVEEGQVVQPKQLLGVVENAANLDEVMALEKLLDTLLRNSDTAIIPSLSDSFYQLGELQKPYQSFQETYLKAKAFVGSGAYQRKRQILLSDVEHLKILANQQENQIINYQSDLELTEADLRMNRGLNKDNKYVSDVEMRQTQSRFISKKQAYDQARSNLENSGISQNGKQQELLEIEKTATEQVNSFGQSARTLKSDIEAWKQRYLLEASQAGKIAFQGNLQENQQLKTGQELLYVVPNQAQYFGEMLVGQYNFGKVKIGQEVIIKLSGYPFQEFGSVEGRVSQIAAVPKDTAYYLKVSLPKGLQTSNNRTLPFQNGLTANGQIITEDLRLIERIFYDFRKMLRK